MVFQAVFVLHPQRLACSSREKNRSLFGLKRFCRDATPLLGNHPWVRLPVHGPRATSATAALLHPCTAGAAAA